ncbi:conserved hypothetical protein [Halorhabdus utahensis DSM 12940]|uniref:Uncharacterized protein n=1 Tax=Halorhabdus utahensis (strain DSM 12940 / JCM 11049 / AX-2) TaxID=519442 RepID=C7NTS7_HALUD|nr:hypothetical protein [Halorhabdus utahensis]ACV10916.1 conserved hypothetical protein [Halorhabdus utahensis DSM 12940]
MFPQKLSPERSSSRDRGQTTLDFAFGVSIFLLVLAFAFTFIPGILQPFAEGTAAETVGANRAADTLAEGTLGDPATPYVLNTTCTVGFFDTGVPSGCRYTGSTATERLSIGSFQDVNVTLRGSTSGTDYSLLCWNGTALTEADSPNCGTGDKRLATGDPIPSVSIPTITARRVVAIDGTTAVIRVVIW